MTNRRETFGGLGNWLFQSAYLYAQMRKGEIPDIYVQDEKYFKDYAEEIKALHKAGIEPIDMVSLHIRRGDYVGNPFYTDLTETDYYQKALAEFPEETFLVFCADRQPKSDDQSDRKWVQKWLNEEFPDRKFQFFDGKDEVEDFNAQAGCKGHVTANSSFSFWSAFVGGGETVYPSLDKWYADGLERTKFEPQDNWKAI